MNDKTREVALRVSMELQLATELMCGDYELGVTEFLTRCLQELSKDVEPVAWQGVSGNLVYDLKSLMPNARHLAKPLYLHPPLTEQDKLDAARYRWLRERMDTKDISIFVQRKVYGVEEWNENIDAAIDTAMEATK